MVSREHYKYGCKYPNCKNKYYYGSSGPDAKNKHFFRFPRNKIIRNIWIKNCNLDPRGFYRNSYVCNDHFLPHHLNFYGTRLVPGHAPIKFTSDSKNTLETSNTCDLIENDYTYSQNDHTYSQNDHTYSQNDHTYSQNDHTYLENDHTYLENDNANSQQNNDNIFDAKEKIIMEMIANLTSDIESDNLLKSVRQLYKNSKFKEIEEELRHLPKQFRKKKLDEAIESSLFSKKWTLDDNLLALWIYKRIPHSYKYLEIMYGLPSSFTLNELLWKIPFQAGVHNTIMNQIKVDIEKLQQQDRFCTLIFGEMKLNWGFSYEKNQIVSGYENLGYFGSTNREANNVLVFMIRGIRKSWKQIVAYYFSCEPIISDLLENILTHVISELQKVGFTVLSTICDLQQTYMVALKKLCGEQTFFNVNNRPIGIIFNVPYLLRSTRNALLRCNIEFQEGKIAKFDYIHKAFNLDREKKIFSELQKLKQGDFVFTKDHIRHDVSIAIHQLSHSVAGSIETWVTLKELPFYAIYTAEFVDCIDNLFDSLTGYKHNCDEGKRYRCALSPNSLHLTFWLDFLRIVDEWKFLDINTNEDVTDDYSLIINGWKITIKSIMYIWDNLKQNIPRHLSLNSFNMDPMNILFDNIKNCYKFPNCHQFVVGLNIDILKNLKPVKKRYDQVECVPLINVKSILEDAEITSPVSPDFKKVSMDFSNLDEYEVSTYVSGYILKYIEIPETCESCNENIFSEARLRIPVAEHYSEIMLYASDQVITLVNKIRQLIFEFLEENAHNTLLKDTFKNTYKRELEVNFCPIHNFEVDIIDHSIDIFIYKWVKHKQNK